MILAAIALNHEPTVDKQIYAPHTREPHLYPYLAAQLLEEHPNDRLGPRLCVPIHPEHQTPFSTRLSSEDVRQLVGGKHADMQCAVDCCDNRIRTLEAGNSLAHCFKRRNDSRVKLRLALPPVPHCVPCVRKLRPAGSDLHMHRRAIENEDSILAKRGHAVGSTTERGRLPAGISTITAHVPATAHTNEVAGGYGQSDVTL